MGDLLRTIASSMGALGNITVILGIIIYIFAVVGMQLFGKVYTKDKFPNRDHIPRYNFKNFGNSFMMIFRILCGKWIEPQWDLLLATNAASIIFIFLVFVIGRWVVSFEVYFLYCRNRERFHKFTKACYKTAVFPDLAARRCLVKPTDFPM